tara:strand:+ start:30 stop:389 length:360 start_codon:yes stop_codon:yes gene_type:complete
MAINNGTMVKFVDSTTAGLAINPAKLFGVAITGAADAVTAGTVEVTLNFEKTTGAATGTSLVTVLATDGAAGVEQKRVFQALANALGGHPRYGAVVEVADDIDGKYIHPDITAISAVTL